MASLEELMNQYASELPDYLRKRGAQANRIPAQEAEEVEPRPAQAAPIVAAAPNVDMTRSRREQNIYEVPFETLVKMRAEKEREFEAANLFAASEAQREIEARQNKPGTVAQQEVFSPQTLEAIKKEEEKLLSKVGRPPVAADTSSTLENALIAFVPALLGGVAGAAAGVPGGTAGGVGAGAAASTESLKAMREDQIERSRLASKEYQKELDVAKTAFKENIKTLTEPELINLKARLNFAYATLQPGAQKAIQEGLINKLSEKQIAMNPAIAARDRVKSQLDAIDKAMVDRLSKPSGKAATETQKGIKPGKGGAAGSAGQQALDRNFAKFYNDYVAQGGSATVQTNLERLEGAISDLKSSDMISGPAAAMIPARFVEKRKKIQDDIRSAIQGTLKQTLGPQFTAKEAEQMFARAFDPNVSETENIRRASNVLNELKSRAAAAEQSIAHWEASGGTLAGFKGMTPGQSEKKAAGAPAAAAAGAPAPMMTEAQKKRLEELQKKYGK